MNDNIKIGADIHAGDGGYSEGTQEKYDEFAKGRNQSLGKMRIKELAIEADIMAPTWNNVPLGYQKFAELIVRECAEMVRIQNEQFMQNESHYGVVSADVLKHFGVEE